MQGVGEMSKHRRNFCENIGSFEIVSLSGSAAESFSTSERTLSAGRRLFHDKRHRIWQFTRKQSTLEFCELRGTMSPGDFGAKESIGNHAVTNDDELKPNLIKRCVHSWRCSTESNGDRLLKPIDLMCCQLV